MGQVNVRTDFNKIYVTCDSFSDRDMVGLVPGSKWREAHGHWELNLTYASCKQLRSIFGEDLFLDDTVIDWATDELEQRIYPCMELRNLLYPSDLGIDASGLDPRLYGYQGAGAQFLASACHGIISDPVGAGKTATAVSAARSLSALPALVVAPKSVLISWQREIEKWWPGTPVYVVDGNKEKRSATILEAIEKSGFVVISWEAVRRHSRLAPYGSMELRHCFNCDRASTRSPNDCHRCEKELNQVPFKLVIADEAHRMQKPQSIQTRAVWYLGDSPSVEYRWALTGTPLTNNIDTLWSILRFINKEEWPSRVAYIDRYCTPPDAPVLLPNGLFKPIGEIKVGDEVVGFSKTTNQPKDECLQTSIVLAVNRRIAEVVKVTMGSGKIIYCTPDHSWLSGSGSQNNGTRSFVKPVVGKKLCSVADVPEELSSDLIRSAAWLGGIADGEGTGYTIASQSPSHNPDVCEEIDRVIKLLNISVRVQERESDRIWICSDRNDYIRFLNYCQPIRRNKRSHRFALGSCRKWKKKDVIIAVEPVGLREVVSLTTTTETYVVYGFASHNCLTRVVPWGSGSEVIGLNPHNEDEFQEIFQPRFRRMPKEIILPQLPPITRTRRYLQMTEPQRRCYEQMAEDMFAETESGELLIAANPAVKMLRMVQFSSATVDMVDLRAEEDEERCVPEHLQHLIQEANERFQEQIELRARLTDPSNKLDALMDDLPDLIEAGEQVVVFAVSRQLIEMAEKRLTNAKPKIKFSVIKGNQKQSYRQEQIDRFQNGKVPVILVVIAAGGTGINLHAARIGIFLQRAWDYISNHQAEGRIHRIGSEIHSSIEYIDYISQGTVDEHVIAIAEGKEIRLEEVVRDREAIRRFLHGEVDD